MQHDGSDPVYRVFFKNQRLGRDYHDFIEAKRAMNRVVRRDRDPLAVLELWEIDQAGTKVRKVYQTRFKG